MLLNLALPEPAAARASLVDLVRCRADAQTDEFAFAFLADGERESARWSYADLEQRARAVAVALDAHRVGRGDRVLLLYAPGLEFISAFFGCLFRGAVAVPMYPPHPSRVVREMPRLRALATSSGASAVLTTSALLPLVERFSEGDAVFAPLARLATDVLPHAALAADWVDPLVTRADLAFLQYTSGSTGTPKGVMVTHGQLLHNLEMVRVAFGHDERSTFVGWLPLYHDMGLIGNVMQPLFLGASCILMPPAAFLQRPVRWLQAITRYRAHTSGGPNFGYDWCVQRIRPEEREGLDLRSWRVAFNGAEPIRASTIAAFAHAFAPQGFRAEASYPCYGLAESTLFTTGVDRARGVVSGWFDAAQLEAGVVSVAAVGQPGAVQLVGSGQVWMDRTLVIANPDTNRPELPGRIGEIWVGGADVASGYWNQPDATADTFGARLAGVGKGPYLRTGDLGFLHGGQVFVAGRLKDLIIVNGRNYFPQDLERSVEESHPAIRAGSVAAFGVERAAEERPVIVAEVGREYLPRGNEQSTGADTGLAIVAEATRKAVAHFHALSLLDVVLLRPGLIPKTSSGKIQRRACRTGYLADSLDGVVYTYSAARTAADRGR